MMMLQRWRAAVVSLASCASLVSLVSLVALLFAPIDAAASDALAQMRQFNAQTRSAQGVFTQQTLKQTGQVSESSSGRFAFSRPGKFRWEVLKPYEQLLVADGQQVYFFDKDLNQVTVRPMDQALGTTPAAILFGAADLDQSFTLTDQGEHDGLAWLEARPKTKDSGFEMIAIGLSGGMPQAMQVRDAFGRLTKFEFSDVERNPAIDAARFRFVPPPGAEVVRQ